MERPWVVSQAYRAAIEAIKSARIECGVSQRELARRLGKPPSFTNKIEKLERRLDIIEFIVIARALSVKPEVLIERLVTALPDKIDF